MWSICSSLNAVLVPPWHSNHIDHHLKFFPFNNKTSSLNTLTNPFLHHRIVQASLQDDPPSKQSQMGYDHTQELYGLDVDIPSRDSKSDASEPRSWFGPNGLYIRELPCPNCRGRGYTPCADCGIERSRKDCSLCSGKGIMTCQKCAGECVIWEESIDEIPWEKVRSSSPLKVKEDDEVDNLELKLDVRKKSKRVYRSTPESLNAKTGLFSNRMKIIHKDPTLHAQRVAAIKKTKRTVAARKQASEALKTFFSDPENRRRRSISMKGAKFFCKNCGQEGHRSNYCPKHGKDLDRRFRCGLCGERGHNRKTCGRPSLPKQRILQHYHCGACGQVGHNRRTCSVKVEPEPAGTLPVNGNALNHSTSHVRQHYRCSLCGQLGHNSRTCPQKSVEQVDMNASKKTRRPYHCRNCGSRKKLPRSLQESLTAAFAKIPVSTFPQVPGGKIIDISADTSIADAVKILSESNIMSAPVTNPDKAVSSSDWRERYLGIIDYSAVILWVLESAELAAFALSATSATAAGVGAGAVGAIGAVALGATGPAAVAGLAVAAVGAAVAGGVAVEKGIGKDAPTAASHLGDDFYKVILEEEPFKSTKVREVIKSFRSTPFLPVSTDSTMLTVMLLLSKYRMRNVPVIEPGKPSMKNFITQSAIIKGLEGCRGRDWFDAIAAHPISDLGLPFMSRAELISINSSELILEAFKRMKDHKIGGLPVVEGPNKKIVGNISMRDIRYLLLKPELFSNFRFISRVNQYLVPVLDIYIYNIVQTFKDFIKTIATISQEVGKVMPAITCKLDVTLGDVIHNLASKVVHRIYVVTGKEDEVVGVITLRDVISCFIFEPPNYFDDYFGFSAKELLKK
ncbi:hypothetical protein KSS87_002403 [Heliosperma pusillum]|nr:hypothetical protein KSS87_002403 [Heliosperma pusillum]